MQNMQRRLGKDIWVIKFLVSKLKQLPRIRKIKLRIWSNLSPICYSEIIPPSEQNFVLNLPRLTGFYGSE